MNATVFDKGAVVDELYWKQVALGGKLVVLAGKIDMLYHFDTNRVANDGYAQFYSYSLQNNPSIPGPLYGGFGGIVRANLPKNAYAMFGVGDSSMAIRRRALGHRRQRLLVSAPRARPEPGHPSCSARATTA